MTTQARYAFMIKSAVLFARNEADMPFTNERVKNYLGTRIRFIEELLDGPDEVGAEHLRSAHNLGSGPIKGFEPERLL